MVFTPKGFFQRLETGLGLSNCKPVCPDDPLLSGSLTEMDSLCVFRMPGLDQGDALMRHPVIWRHHLLFRKESTVDFVYCL